MFTAPAEGTVIVVSEGLITMAGTGGASSSVGGLSIGIRGGLTPRMGRREAPQFRPIVGGESLAPQDDQGECVSDIDEVDVEDVFIAEIDVSTGFALQSPLSL